MVKEKHTSAIYKLRISHKLSLEEVEKAFSAASHKAMIARKVKTEGAELARVDLLKDKTVVFLRGEKAVADGLKKILKKKKHGAKLAVAKTTHSALAKAP